MTKVRGHNFLTKGCENVIPIRNEEISPVIFLINSLKIIVYERKITAGLNGAFPQPFRAVKISVLTTQKFVEMPFPLF